MTRNQIEYWRLKEQQRATDLTNALKADELAEAKRSNRAREYESQRSNLANERIKSEQNIINQGHYERSDAETQRHNVALEGISSAQLGVDKQKIALGYSQLQETQRSNLASEATAKRQADANVSNAFTRAKEQAFSEYKYNTPEELGQRQANVAKTATQVTLQQAQIETERTKPTQAKVSSWGQILSNVWTGIKTLAPIIK